MPDVNHLDVTQCIDLTRPDAVCAAVCTVLGDVEPAIDRQLIEQAFTTFGQLYAGTLPDYHGCETLYHDMRHALDVTLACARLLAGHERRQAVDVRLGAERLTLGIVVALFHDAGYIRHRRDRRCWHGAQYTLHHVSRGGRLLSRFLLQQEHGHWTKRAMKLIHFTGYEIPLDKLRLHDPLDQRLGQLIGTADLIAQMADRAYLEKCRDYLYEEFELGGLTRKHNTDGSIDVLYACGDELLSKTPAFYATTVRNRLDVDFEQGYHFLEALFEGRNPYLEAIERNMAYLDHVLDADGLQELLRRRPEPILAPQGK